MSGIFAEGDVVRVEGWRGAFVLVRIYLTSGECDVWGPADNPGMRVVETTRLREAEPGAVAPQPPQQQQSA